MGKRPITSKGELLEAAYSIASEKGLSGVNVREVASACNVAVGTVYNWYPTKSALVNDVIARFWREALADCMPQAADCGNFIDFCCELHARVAGAFSSFREGWLAEVSSMGARDRGSAHNRAQACFDHICRGLAIALESDTQVDRSKLEGELSPDALCLLIWDSILVSLRRNDDSCRTLFALLRKTLYAA